MIYVYQMYDWLKTNFLKKSMVGRNEDPIMVIKFCF